jgi:hypothetical protein
VRHAFARGKRGTLCGFRFTFMLDVCPFCQSLAAEWQHTLIAMFTGNNPPPAFQIPACLCYLLVSKFYFLPPTL